METPLVSIFTLAYNHAPYIRQCLEGFLMQRTTFSFECLIHDDASTDETADIIREYESRYPDIIKPIYQTENQYSKGGGITRKFLIPRAQGKYIAICEGDDYWTDPLKLQKQVDFLETHPDYTICGGMYRILKEGDTELTERDLLVREMKKFPKGRTVTLQNYLEPYLLQFLTVCYRKDCFNIERLDQIKYSKDDTIYAMLLEQGKGFVFPDYFGVYRMHQSGIWAGMTNEQQIRANAEFLQEMALHFGNKSKSIRKWCFIRCIEVSFIELKTSQHLFKDYMKMVRFTFSGKVQDVIFFQIWYFLRKSKRTFMNHYFRNKPSS